MSRRDPRALVLLLPLAVLGAARISSAIPLAGGRLTLEPGEGIEIMTVTPTRVTARADGGKLLLLIDMRREPETERSKLLESLLSALRQEGKVLGAEVVQPATVVETPFISAKVIDTIKVEGKVSSRSRSIRRVGGFTLEMFAIATSNADGERETLLTKAEDDVLRKASLAASRKPESDGKDKRLDLKIGLSVPQPTGWTLSPTAEKEGVVARGENGSGKIVVVVTPVVPAAEGTPDDFVAAADARALATEDAALDVRGMVEPQKVQDGRFFLRGRRAEGEVVTDRRVRRIGNALVSVAMACKPSEEERVARAADAIATGIAVR